MTTLVRRANEGREFETGSFRVSITVGGSETNGAYSLSRWTVAPRFGSTEIGHSHARYEETFLITRGRLDFVLGRDVIPLGAGDFVRVPPGTRHAFLNPTDEPVEMLVGFVPGGMEEFFLEHRTDTRPFDQERYLREARELHGTEYELPAGASLVAKR